MARGLQHFRPLHLPRYLTLCNSFQMESQPAIVNTAEACEMLGDVNRSTLKRWVDAGKVEPFRKLPGETGGYLFYRADIEALIEALASEQAEQAASAPAATCP